MPSALIIDTDPSPADAVAFPGACASPEEFSSGKVNVAVEAASPPTLDMTAVDWSSVTGEPANVQVLREIDADGYFDLVIERLGRL